MARLQALSAQRAPRRLLEEGAGRKGRESGKFRGVSAEGLPSIARQPCGGQTGGALGDLGSPGETSGLHGREELTPATPRRQNQGCSARVGWLQAWRGLGPSDIGSIKTMAGVRKKRAGLPPTGHKASTSLPPPRSVAHSVCRGGTLTWGTTTCREPTGTWRGHCWACERCR